MSVVITMMMMMTGENVAEDDNMMRSQLAKTEISLTLSNKHELPDSDDTDKTRLLLRSVLTITALTALTHSVLLYVLPVCMSICLSVYLSVCLCLYESLFLSLSLCLYVCVSVCDSTKQMIVDVIRCQKSGDSLVDILRHSVTPDEASHKSLVMTSLMCCCCVACLVSCACY